MILFSNIIHEQDTYNTILTNNAYPGYCIDVLCWRPPEKALAYLAVKDKRNSNFFVLVNAKI